MTYYVVSLVLLLSLFYFFFFNDTATTEIYTLSLHDALPISTNAVSSFTEEEMKFKRARGANVICLAQLKAVTRSEEHTSELQSRQYLVCRLLLEKKKTKQLPNTEGHKHLTEHS